MPLELGVLVSGDGTNLQAILDATRDGSLAANVRCVISNRAGVKALERAAHAGVPAFAIAHQGFDSREAFDRALVAVLREQGVEWLALAGFMRVLTPELLGAFPGRIVNIHPSLLPSFPGRDAIGQALRHRVKVTGCTVHFVDAGVDSGPIIAQQAVDVLDGDSEETLALRMHEAEHGLLLNVLRGIASGHVRPSSPRAPA